MENFQETMVAHCTKKASKPLLCHVPLDHCNVPSKSWIYVLKDTFHSSSRLWISLLCWCCGRLTTFLRCSWCVLWWSPLWDSPALEECVLCPVTAWQLWCEKMPPKPRGKSQFESQAKEEKETTFKTWPRWWWSAKRVGNCERTKLGLILMFDSRLRVTWAS